MKYFLSLLLFFLILEQGTFAQCFPDRHNTSWNDGWISCAASSNPNPDRETSHWILYNLGYTYHLGQMHVWNTNAPGFLADGISRAVIDVSIDGANWIEIGQFDFEQGSGSSEYEGFDGPDLSGNEAKYLLITALDNWGGNCYGLSEIRVDVHGITHAAEFSMNSCLELEVFPNPLNSGSKARIYAACNSEDILYEIRDITGRTVRSGQLTPTSGLAVLDLNAHDLISGSYILSVHQNGNTRQQKIVRID